MKLFKRIQRLIQNENSETLLKGLGYQNLNKGHEVLQAFVNASSLYEWISRGHYDFKYDAMSLYKALCDYFDIEEADCASELLEAQALQQKIVEAQAPYIFIETHFTRNNEPIFMLAMMEGLRRIYLSKEDIISHKSLEETLEFITQVIIKHYQEIGGHLKVWGKVQEYVYHHINGEVFVFTPQGVLKEKQEHRKESEAVIKQSSKKISS